MKRGHQILAIIAAAGAALGLMAPSAAADTDAWLSTTRSADLSAQQQTLIVQSRPGHQRVISSDGCSRWDDYGNIVVIEWWAYRTSPFYGRCLQTRKINLVWQEDGNLVIYRRQAPGGAAWSTRTNSRGSWVRYQTDGNFAVYQQNVGAIWSSGTCCVGWSRQGLNVQADGNVVIYRDGRAIWQTRTHY